jgi:hypothetical protein
MIPVAGKSGTGTGPGVRPRVWQIGTPSDPMGAAGTGAPAGLPGAAPISAASDRECDSRPGRPRDNLKSGTGTGIGDRGVRALLQSAVVLP